MKKNLLLIVSMLIAIGVSAANWTVTVSTQNNIRFVDAKTGETVGETTEVGRTLTFEIVADTPNEAENMALNQCQGACSTGYYKTIQENVSYKGKLCNKQCNTVPYSARAVLSNKTAY